MFHFHKVAYVQYLGEVDIFSYVGKKSSSLQQCNKKLIRKWDSERELSLGAYDDIVHALKIQ